MIRALALVCTLLGCGEPGPAPPERGIALGLFASTPTWDYGPLIAEIAHHKATEVLVVVPLRQATVHSAELTAVVPEATLRQTLAQARSAGLRVSLMPIIELEHRPGGVWRGRLAPTEPAQWWQAYTSHLRRLADLGREAGVYRLVVGSELCSLEADDPQWRALISLIRKHFPGRLTYSANWDHFRDVPFWGALDEVAVTAYFPVGEASIEGHLAAARRFAEGLGRPLVVTELGYPSLASAREAPWDDRTGVAPDERLQAELLQTGLEATRSAGTSAVFVWNWFGNGGAADQSFTPRGKPAAATLRRTFAAWERARP